MMAVKERKPKTRTCRYHCAACGRHFTSLTAFDRHRQGDYDEGRYCSAPAAVNEDAEHEGKKAVYGEPLDGECRLSGETQQAKLWQIDSDADFSWAA